MTEPSAMFHLKLSSALLCIECGSICSGENEACPCCTCRTLFQLSSWLDTDTIKEKIGKALMDFEVR